MDLNSIHFVGIGGIGISGLARYLQAQGVEVSGSDISESCSTKYLRSLGVQVAIPHDKNNIKNPNLLVHSAIIDDDNVELAQARAKNIPILSRKDALKIILAKKRVFSVCGAHGKSSTTAMLSAIFKDYGAIIGAISKEFGSNVRAVQSESVVFEADESDGSFLNSNPYCAIVTNAEPEHMEHYNYDLELFHRAYADFLTSAKKRVFNAEDEFLASLNLPATRLYPHKDIANIKYFLEDDEPFTEFSLNRNGKFVGNFRVWGFGFHTASNASLAILSALDEMDSANISQNLLNYKGIQKRFDIVCKGEKCVIIDDYAHHPTEIKSTLDSIKHYARLKNIRNITAIWQPHKYSRTIHNIDGFAESFAGVDNLVILPVWGTNESPIPIDFNGHFGRYAPIMADCIHRSGATLEIVKDGKILNALDSGLIVGFGAGDITYQMRGAI
ncbi:UDP-N-acetylmuramate--L-alanine ligase [Helicobacter sp. 23-1045]